MRHHVDQRQPFTHPRYGWPDILPYPKHLVVFFSHMGITHSNTCSCNRNYLRARFDLHQEPGAGERTWEPEVFLESCCSNSTVGDESNGLSEGLELVLSQSYYLT
jgi:hypothetical protein